MYLHLNYKIFPKVTLGVPFILKQNKWCFYIPRNIQIRNTWGGMLSITAPPSRCSSKISLSNFSSSARTAHARNQSNDVERSNWLNSKLCHWGGVIFHSKSPTYYVSRPSRILKCLFKYVAHNWNISPNQNIYGLDRENFTKLWTNLNFCQVVVWKIFAAKFEKRCEKLSDCWSLGNCANCASFDKNLRQMCRFLEENWGWVSTFFVNICLQWFNFII